VNGRHGPLLCRGRTLTSSYDLTYHFNRRAGRMSQFPKLSPSQSVVLLKRRGIFGGTAKAHEDTVFDSLCREGHCFSLAISLMIVLLAVHPIVW
jgi:hypothetical protein